MDPMLQLQDDATMKLNCEAAFQYVPAFSYRKTVITKDVKKLTPHLVGKNGKMGVGVIVGMPSVTGVFKGVSVPQSKIYLPIDVIEQGELNMTLSNGSRMNAEQVALAVRRALHAFSIEGLGTLIQDDKAIEPLAGLEKDFPGCIGYRIGFEALLQEGSVPKVVAPEIDFDSNTGVIAMLSATPGATLYYVRIVDVNNPPESTFPCSVNPAAVVYDDNNRPNGAIGDVIRFAAYHDGYAGSNVGQATLTANT